MNGVLGDLPEQGISGGPTNCGILWQLPIRLHGEHRAQSRTICSQATLMMPVSDCLARGIHTRALLKVPFSFHKEADTLPADGLKILRTTLCSRFFFSESKQQND